MTTRARSVASDERGFTLAEVLVTMLMMLTVLFALYAIFDTSIRVFSFGNDKTEAVQNARLGLERMEREIRAAYPVNKGADEDHLFFSEGDSSTSSFPEDDEITFGNERDGDRVISEDEEITYKLDDNSTLKRDGSAAVENVENLSFEYFDASGCRLGSPECTEQDESDIRMVRIEILVEVDEGDQELSTDVALRNRSG